MAKRGVGFFDRKGHYFKTATEATVSDIAAVLGKIGDGESLAPGIAHTLLERRGEIEALFTEHDSMMSEVKGAERGSNIASLPRRAARG